MAICRRFCALVLVALASLSLAPARGAELLTYRGELRSLEAEAADTAFTLVVLVGSNETDRQLYWALDEAAARGWSWVDRIGELTWDEHGRTAAEAGPALRYDNGAIAGEVPLVLISTRPQEPWGVGVRWEHEGLEHEVAADASEGNRPAWRVAVRNNFGEKRTMTVALPHGVVQNVQERVFLGQGERYELRYELAERTNLDAAAAEQTRGEFASLVAVRNDLQVTPREADRRWTDEQRAQLRSRLPALAENVRSPAVSQVLKAALDEAKEERGRAGALEAMRKKALQSELPGFDFEPVGNVKLTRGDLDQTVTVFHFWDYRDTPLREPYGQSGFLDYLHRKYESEGVRVIGVVVNQNTEQAADHRQAILSARRFANFMNLSYPLFVDKGTLLQKLGDPRLCDTKLPLFVAVGKDGRVVHYSAGNYAVENNQGLAELEAVIKQALQTAR